MSSLLKTALLVLEEVWYTVFPLTSDERLIKNIAPEVFLKKLNVQKRDEVIFLSNFKDPQVRSALHLVKFHGHSKGIALTSTLLQAYLHDETRFPITVIPIPLSGQRLRHRGFNQSTLICQAACRDLDGCEVNEQILLRTRHTNPQTSLSRAERLINLAGAFAINNKAGSLTGKHIIIFDDVTTTGATLKAAKAALLPLSPASVTCVALAH